MVILYFRAMYRGLGGEMDQNLGGFARLKEDLELPIESVGAYRKISLRT